MSTELEHAIADALRAKAGTAPTPPMPSLGSAATKSRRWLVPIAAALVTVVAVGAALFVLIPRDDGPATGPVASSDTEASNDELAPGEVYYSRRLSTAAEGVFHEEQLWLPRDRAGEWRREMTQGQSIENGRVVPGGGRIGAAPGGFCYPNTTPSEPCDSPASWTNPTVEFLATAPRDPATIGRQIHALAVDGVTDIGEGGDETLAYQLELRLIGHLLPGNGVPTELSSALRQVVAAIPGITITENMPNLAGEEGTGYSLPHPRSGLITVIFNADDRYIGSQQEAVHHGVAPGLGQPPSRMLD